MKKSKKAIIDLLTKGDKNDAKFENRVLNLALQKINSDSFEFDGEAVYSADKTLLVYYLADKETFAVPEGVKVIGEMAFRAKKQLRNIIIPSTVEEIGRDAFYDCDALDNVYLPASVLSVKAYAFADCDSLRTITFAATPAHLSHRTFDMCDHLSLIIVPAGAAKAFRKALHFVNGDTDYIVVERHEARKDKCEKTDLPTEEKSSTVKEKK